MRMLESLTPAMLAAQVATASRRSRRGPVTWAAALVRKAVVLAAVGGASVAASRSGPGKRVVEAAERGIKELRLSVAPRRERHDIADPCQG